MTKFIFRLTGVPPQEALKKVNINPNGRIADIKKSVKSEFKLNPLLAIQLIFKGKVLSNRLSFNYFGINYKEDIISIMANQVAGVSRLEMVLKELNENGNFRASLFSTSTGLVLASQKAEDVDERVVAAMGSLLSDAAIKAGEEMNLSEAQVMKIFYREDYIICRNIEMKDGKTQFLLAVLAKAPESDEVERYFDQLLDWAVDNSSGDLEKLSSI
ncbi:MAG: roadblock/LC7 domain-containing protein [Candidatus Hermodarchaeota archaeon]